MNKTNTQRNFPKTEEQEIDNILSSIRELIADEVKNDPTIKNVESASLPKTDNDTKNNEKKVLELTNSIDDIGFNSNIEDENSYIGKDNMINFEDNATATTTEIELEAAAEEATTEDIATAETTAAPEEATKPTEAEASTEAEAGADANATEAPEGNGESESKNTAEENIPEVDEAMLEKIDTLEVGEADIEIEGTNENDNPGAQTAEGNPNTGPATIEVDEAMAAAAMGDGDNNAADDQGTGPMIDEAHISNELKAGLVSDETIEKAAEALSTLESLTMVPENAAELDRKVGQKTVDELMQEILRPLLKEWLDANLPSLVKWVVTEQVEKLIREKMKGK